jgi:hypothetical protein
MALSRGYSAAFALADLNGHLGPDGTTTTTSAAWARLAGR